MLNALRIILAVCVIGVAAPSVQAQTESQSENQPQSQSESWWYTEAVAGKRFLADGEWEVGGATSEADTSGFGAGGSGAFGYGISAFPRSWLSTRFELEGGHAENEPKTLRPRGALATFLEGTRVRPIGGNVKGTWGMANVWFDTELDPGLLPSPFVLTAGFGLGAAWLDFQKISTVTSRGETVIIKDDDVVFAYQAGLGLGYQWTPRITTSVYYRFLDALDPSFGTPPGELEAEYRSHNLFLGVRYSFR